MRLPHVIPFSNSPRYFLTACTKDRRAILANDAAFLALQSVWTKSAEADGWHVGRFVVMPDHVHLFAAPFGDAKSLGAWNKMWKSVTARAIAKSCGLRPPIWQEDTFDHILRGVESYDEKWEYVRRNPVRAGLVPKIADWHWQGEINRLTFE